MNLVKVNTQRRMMTTQEESPIYLAHSGEIEEAKRVVEKFYGHIPRNKSTSEELAKHLTEVNSSFQKGGVVVS